MLKPLQQWICDHCGKPIKSPEDGWLEWLRPDDIRSYGFKIVHHSPRASAHRCYHYDGHRDRADDHLECLLGMEGFLTLTSWLDVGRYHEREFDGPYIRDMREFVHVFRRLQVPYYEEGSRHLEQAVADGLVDSGMNEVAIYSERTMKEVAARYSPF